MHLFDHNILDCFQSHLSPYVTSIMDHHADEQAYEVDKRIEFRGSAISMVLDEILADEAATEAILDSVTARLFAPAMVLDTANFLPKLKDKKWVEADLEVMA